MGQVDDALTVAEQAWSWVLSQIDYTDEGPILPVSVPTGGQPISTEEDEYPDSIYEGVGGLALALDEIRRHRRWSAAEESLAAGISDRLSRANDKKDVGISLGLCADITALNILGNRPVDHHVARVADLAVADGWVIPDGDQMRNYLDLLLGTAGVALTMRWLNQDGDEILGHALNSILRHGNRVATGLEWPMTLDDQSYGKMPNFSHGTAGIAATLAIVGHHLGRQDALDAALLGAEHVVAIADTDDGLFRVETMIPIGNRDIEQYAYGWCHGPTGTAYMFAALDHAGIHELSGVTCDEWITRALRTVETSGVPDRIRPGFWDNDGRCCGTAGVLDFALDVIQRHPDAVDFEFADRLADALVARAIRKNGQAYWRFTEHRRENPLLDPVTGWMQGAAGIAAALMRYHRVRQDPSGASRQSRPESWWMVD